MRVVIGRVSLNMSEIASKMDRSSVEEKLPLSMQIDGFAREASLTVNTSSTLAFFPTFSRIS